MSNIRFTIAANETKRFEIAGRFFEVLDAAGPITVTFDGNAGSVVRREDGVYSGLFIEEAFTAFEVRSATAQTIEILYLNGRGGSRRQPGIVRVIDQGTEKSISGLQFLCSLTGAIVGQHQILALRAVARRVAIKRLTVSCSSAGAVPIGTGTASPTVGYALQGTARNKLTSGAASSAVREYGQAAGPAPTVGEVPGYSGLITQLVTANVPTEVPLTTPLVLEVGHVLIVTAPVAGATVNYTADIEELT